MIYGPLYPIVYLLVAVALLFSYCCTKTGLVYWYMRPPNVDQRMMASLRTNLGLIVVLMIIPMALGARAVSEDNKVTAAKLTIYLVAPILWLVYTVAPLGKIPFLSDHSEVDEILDAAEDNPNFDWDSLEGDTHGIRIEDVSKEKGYEVFPYICPKITQVGVEHAARPRTALLAMPLSTYA